MRMCIMKKKETYDDVEVISRGVEDGRFDHWSLILWQDQAHGPLEVVARIAQGCKPKKKNMHARHLDMPCVPDFAAVLSNPISSRVSRFAWNPL
jgi:hypothetical protein